uniref:Inorganic phosphate transporter n=1 Tax=Opuntia streptacantha TaxID=393608 RepID=A0A7C9DH04_OPUST
MGAELKQLWCHLTAVAVSGMGFFNTAYSICCIHKSSASYTASTTLSPNHNTVAPSPSNVFAELQLLMALPSVVSLQVTSSSAGSMKSLGGFRKVASDLVPGHLLTANFIGTVIRSLIQCMGFSMMRIFMFIIAFSEHWQKHKNKVGFIIMHGLTLYFANFGPNVPNFVAPGEIFKLRLTLTCHSTSAAVGMAGAIVEAFGFLCSSQDKDLQTRDAGYPTGIRRKMLLL